MASNPTPHDQTNENSGSGTWDFLTVYIYALGPMVLVAGAVALMNWFKEPAEQQECWKLQSINEVVYKINACTGETIKLESD